MISSSPVGARYCNWEERLVRRERGGCVVKTF